jgi:hypothetical protein
LGLKPAGFTVDFSKELPISLPITNGKLARTSDIYHSSECRYGLFYAMATFLHSVYTVVKWKEINKEVMGMHVNTLGSIPRSSINNTKYLKIFMTFMQ